MATKKQLVIAVYQEKLLNGVPADLRSLTGVFNKLAVPQRASSACILDYFESQGTIFCDYHTVVKSNKTWNYSVFFDLLITGESPFLFPHFSAGCKLRERPIEALYPKKKVRKHIEVAVDIWLDLLEPLEDINEVITKIFTNNDLDEEYAKGEIASRLQIEDWTRIEEFSINEWYGGLLPPKGNLVVPRMLTRILNMHPDAVDQDIKENTAIIREALHTIESALILYRGVLKC